MKCDYCLMDIPDGAAVCGHCGREQLVSVEARVAKAEAAAGQKREKNYGCVLKVILSIVGAFIALVMIGSCMRDSQMREDQVRNTQQAAENTCTLFVAAGDFTSTTDCTVKANIESLGLYVETLRGHCRDLRSSAQKKTNDCEVQAGRITKRCSRLQQEADQYFDEDACMVSERKADRVAGLTIANARAADKYRKPPP